MPALLRLRLLVFLTLTFSASLLTARVAWIVGKNVPVDAVAVAKAARPMLGEDIQIVETGTLFISAWANDPAQEDARAAVLAADTLLITPSENDPDGLAFLGLSAIRAQRPLGLLPPIVVAVQAPVYKMNGLCDNQRLQRTAQLAIGAGFGFLPLPKIWQRVYTDDTFYNGKVPKGPVTETYIFAAGIVLGIKGEKATLPSLPGVHTKVADALIASIRKGLVLREDVLYVAERMSTSAYDVRVGNAFSAVLYDGAFEHAIGRWLLRLAKADGRELTLHYTTDTRLDTGLPCLFRTTNPLGKTPEACVYTRPAFDDDTGLAELAHLTNILSADATRPGWMPFPLAIAEWIRRLTGKPVYDGATPTEAAAAMFATMVYLKWTGAAVLPSDCDPTETVAIGIGLETMLRTRVLRTDVNAIFCRPLGKGRYAFSLWRRPSEKIRLNLATDVRTQSVSPDTLTFQRDTFWSRQTVTTTGPATLFWKVPAANFPGQNTGARTVE